MRLPVRLSAFFSDPGVVPLDEALLWVASLRPGASVDIGEHLRLLDTWAETAPSSDVEGLRVLVYDRLGFRGDDTDVRATANDTRTRARASTVSKVK